MGKQPKISIIVAMTPNRLIGAKNKLLWHIPEELKRFKEITMGHPIIMGRKTFESIGRVLFGRTNVIVTRDPNYKVQDALVVHSLEEAIEKSKFCAGSTEIFIIGGGQIYEQALPLTDKLYLTIVEIDPTSARGTSFEGDTYFPEYEHLFKKKVFEKEIEAEGSKDGKPQTFKIKFLELEK